MRITLRGAAGLHCAASSSGHGRSNPDMPQMEVRPVSGAKVSVCNSLRAANLQGNLSKLMICYPVLQLKARGFPRILGGLPCVSEQGNYLPQQAPVEEEAMFLPQRAWGDQIGCWVNLTRVSFESRRRDPPSPEMGTVYGGKDENAAPSSPDRRPGPWHPKMTAVLSTSLLSFRLYVQQFPVPKPSSPGSELQNASGSPSATKMKTDSARAEELIRVLVRRPD